MSRIALLFSILILAPGAVAETVVTVHGDRMSIRATKASLAEIFEHIHEKTGMKVIYDGTPPPQPISLTVPERTQAAAVLAVLEGRALNFALVTNSSGTMVDTILITSAPVHVQAPQFRDDDSSFLPTDVDIPTPAPQGISGVSTPEPTPTPAQPAVPTAAPQSISPFTPQGPGPVILMLPGATPSPAPTPAPPPSPE